MLLEPSQLGLDTRLVAIRHGHRSSQAALFLCLTCSVARVMLPRPRCPVKWSSEKWAPGSSTLFPTCPSLS